MNILIPTSIFGITSILTGSSLAEPGPGEVAWVPGVAQAVGDKRYVATTHRIYKCAAALTAAQNVNSPETDSTNWEDYAPTNKWAAFDTQVTTQAVAPASPLTYTLRPGFFNAVWLGGLEGNSAEFIYKDGPGGTVINDDIYQLIEDPRDWYDYLFGGIKQKTKQLRSGYAPYPDPELTISIAGTTPKCGMVAVGDLTPLSSLDNFGTMFGAKAEPVDYSYIDYDKTDGTAKIVKGNSATDMRASVRIDKSDADAALATLQAVLATPALFIATEETGYAGLQVFGLGTASVSYDSAKHSTISIYVKGLV